MKLLACLLLLLQTDSIPGAAPAKAGELGSSLSMLKSASLNDLISILARSTVKFAINLAIAIAVFYAGRFIIKRIYRLVAAIFLSRKLDRSLSTFVLSLINIVLYFILIVTVIGIIGIETSSFLALFASAGVAIGMALSGTLQNFAGGVLILILKPYKIGDYIEAQGYAGTVKEIQIFFTIITTPDNKSISIPNGGLSTASVNNWTREEYRRVNWDVAISYGDDVDSARAAILQMFDNDSRILQPVASDNIAVVEGDGTTSVEPVGEEPQNGADHPQNTEGLSPEPRESFWSRFIHRSKKTKAAIAKREELLNERLAALTPAIDFTPKVFVKELADSSVNLTIRAWVNTKDYWGVYYYYNEHFYNELPKAGINFPFPQMDVHLRQPK